MKVLKITALITALVLMFTLPVSATVLECTVTPSEDEVSIMGTAEPNSDVFVNVVESTTVPNTFFGSLKYQNKAKADEFGLYNITFKMNGSGLFTVIDTNNLSKDEFNFAFSDSATGAGLLESINTESDVKSLLQEKRNEYGLYFDGVNYQPDYEGIAELVKAERPFMSFDEAFNFCQQFTLYCYVSRGQIENLFDYDGVLKIDDIDRIEVFTPDMFRESHQEYATKFLYGKSFDNREDFEEKLTEAMILAVIANPDGYGNVETVLTHFDDVIGIDLKDAGPSIYKNLVNQKFASYKELRDKYNELIKKKNSQGSGTGSSGSGTGGALGTTLYTPNDYTQAEVVPGPDGNIKFKDLAGYEWAEEAIEALREKGVVKGKEPGAFHPGDPVTRSEFIKMIVLAFNVKESTDTVIAFSDTNAESWDYTYIRDAYAAGIIKGITDTYFGCEEPISRQDIAVIMQRITNAQGGELAERFADDRQIDEYAYDAVYSLRLKGIMNGDNNYFYPINTATRAETAMVIYSASK